MRTLSIFALVLVGVLVFSGTPAHAGHSGVAERLTVYATTAVEVFVALTGDEASHDFLIDLLADKVAEDYPEKRGAVVDVLREWLPLLIEQARAARPPVRVASDIGEVVTFGVVIPEDTKETWLTIFDKALEGK